jgi:hypothetical protein
MSKRALKSIRFLPIPERCGDEMEPHADDEMADSLGGTFPILNTIYDLYLPTWRKNCLVFLTHPSRSSRNKHLHASRLFVLPLLQLCTSADSNRSL